MTRPPRISGTNHNMWGGACFRNRDLPPKEVQTWLSLPPLAQFSEKQKPTFNSWKKSLMLSKPLHQCLSTEPGICGRTIRTSWRRCGLPMTAVHVSTRQTQFKYAVEGGSPFEPARVPA